MKRQSTVAKLSKTMLKQLIEFCQTWDCGVILRFRGIEYSYTVAELETMLLDLTSYASVDAGFKWTFGVVPTIRKGWQFESVEQLDAINNSQNRRNGTTFGAVQKVLGLKANTQTNIDTIDRLAKLAWEHQFA